MSTCRLYPFAPLGLDLIVDERIENKLNDINNLRAFVDVH